MNSLILYYTFLQLIIAVTWLLTYRKLDKDVIKLERKGFFYTLSLNAWLILFVSQVIATIILKINIQSGYVALFGTIIYTLGVIIALLARMNLGKSWGLPMQHNVSMQKELIISGIYKFSRNPIYLAEMVMLVGFEIVFCPWLLVLVIPFYLWNNKKATLEEEILGRIYGEKYEKYRKKVPRFF